MCKDVCSRSCSKWRQSARWSFLTWAVDYVLLDENDEPTSPWYAYRDNRTAGIDVEVYKAIPEKELYARTGIQKAIFNTIYQLAAAKAQEPETLERAKTLLMLPDYFNFLLTGVKCQEYTNATTTQLVNPQMGRWDFELIERLGLPADIFQEIRMPGKCLGRLLPEIRKQVGYDCQVVLPAPHDTASAVMSIPSESDDVLYLSSGAWSFAVMSYECPQHLCCNPVFYMQSGSGQNLFCPALHAPAAPVQLLNMHSIRFVILLHMRTGR